MPGIEPTAREGYSDIAERNVSSHSSERSRSRQSVSAVEVSNWRPARDVLDPIVVDGLR